MRFSALFRSFPPRACRVLAVVALALPALGLWQLDGPQSTFDVKGPVAQRQLDLFMVTFWVTLFLFIVVGSLLAYATWKFRARSEADERAAPPPQAHGNPMVELGITIGSILCLVIIAVPTLKAIWFTDDVPAELKGQAYEITATGYQWWFKFEYPGENAKTLDPVTHQPVDAPLTTANELVIPAGRPVHINLRTVDVIHSFWVPKLAGKVDMMPNRANRMWLEADEPGYFYGQCAQYCGEDHSLMRFRVIALSAKDFAAWLDNQKKAARTVAAMADAPANPVRVVLAELDLSGRDPRAALSGDDSFNKDPFAAWQDKQKLPAAPPETPALIAEGRRLFKEKTCIGCHTIRGQEGVGVTGPELTHVGARSTIAAGVLENTAPRMNDWITNPEHWKPGDKMFNGGYTDPANSKADRKISLSEANVAALVAYLQSLK
jgi:cytochrome c oxidase subunit 2